MLLREVDPTTEWPVVEASLLLRQRVWSEAMREPLTRDDLIEPFDATARHWMVFDGDHVVAAARLSIHARVEDVPEACCLVGVLPRQPPAPIGFLSRLVVAPEHRRHGLGRQLDEIRIEAAVEAGCRSLLALVFDVSGDARVKQFLSHGFTVVGRGQRDDHPKFAFLSAPLVVEHLLKSDKPLPQSR
jgi:GNAT superfamily N-acetyltransferase